MPGSRTLSLEADRTLRLAAWLCRLREERGISQAALAQGLSVNQSVVSRVEHGQRRLSVPELLAWADALDLGWRQLSVGIHELWQMGRRD